METEPTYTSFAGQCLIVSADVRTMLLRTKAYLDRGGSEAVLIFEDRTGRQTEFDFRGTPEDVLARLATDPAFAPKAAPKPGRPKLGVVCREVSLLPRHWEWLDHQPNGASAALRRLVENANKGGRSQELGRRAREAASHFMWVMAGNLPGFEEASRALYAKDQGRFDALIRGWPADIRKHLERLVSEAVRLERQAGSGAESPAAAPPD